MQELIDEMNEMLFEGGESSVLALRDKAVELLEKERLQISEAYYNAFINATKGIDQEFKDYQKETFNTK